MTKAADPVAGPRPCEGSRPVFLDRIPGWERTRLAVASGGSADRVGVRLSGVVLLAVPEAGARLDLCRPLAKPPHANTRGSARRRHLTDICGAGGGQDARAHDSEGRASIQRRSRNCGAQTCHRNEDLVAIHSATPFRQGVVSSPRNMGRSLSTLVGEGNSFFWLSSVPSPARPARGGRPAQVAALLRSRCGPQVAVRTRPSCTTDTASSPSSVKTCPRARPRAPAAVGDSWSYRSQRSARNGRWNHIA